MLELLFLFFAHHALIRTGGRFNPLWHLLWMMYLSDWHGIPTCWWLIFCDKLCEGRCERPSSTIINCQLHWDNFILFWHLVEVACARILRIDRLLTLFNLWIISIIILKSNNVFFAFSKYNVPIWCWLPKLAFMPITEPTDHRRVICRLLLISDGTL